MKTPPPVDEHVVTANVPADIDRDRRFLVFAGTVLAALAVGLKSELIAPGSVWWVSAGLVLVAGPIVLVYLWARTRPALAGVEHFIPAVLGALSVAGFAIILTNPFGFIVVTALFGTGFAFAARLDYDRLAGQPKRGHTFIQEAILAGALTGGYLAVVTAPFSLALKLAWIFAVSALAAFRSFRLSGDHPLPPRRAVLFSLLVAQVVAFFAWAIFSYISGVAEGVFAVMLLLAWYINRGVIRHTAEESLTRHVVMEYGLFAALLAFLFVYSYRG